MAEEKYLIPVEYDPFIDENEGDRSYAEGELMPPTEVQRRSMEELRYEFEALQGQRPREQDLMDTLFREPPLQRISDSRDRVELAPGQYPTGVGGTQRSVIQNDVGIYGGYKPSPPGDEVVYDPEAARNFRYDDTKNNVYSGQSRRLYEEMARQHKSGGLADPEAYKRILPYQDELLSQDKNALGEALRGQDPSFSRRISDVQLLEVDYDPFIEKQTPVEHDPYAEPTNVYEQALQDYPILRDQGVVGVRGERPMMESWPINEPGGPDWPRPAGLPMDKFGVEYRDQDRPIDILGDVVSHHMIEKDPVVRKYYENFTTSLNPEQRQRLQEQYKHAQDNENEKRPYEQWEEKSGLPAYFRGYPFKQWPEETHEKFYTPEQREHLDRMMGYLKGAK